MARSIRITADTAQLKKSISDLSRTVTKDLGKSKIELFTPDTKKFLRSEAVSYAENLKKKMDGIKKSTLDHQAALKKANGNLSEELRIKNKILKASQLIVEMEKEHQDVVAATSSLQQSAFSRQYMKFSGMSAMMKGFKALQGQGGGGGPGGLLGMLGAGLGSATAMLGAGALGAAGYGVSRVFAGRDEWKQGVQDRLKLMGRGETNLEPQNVGAMNRAGLNAQTMRAARLQSMDVFGREGATEQAVVKRAGFERSFGMEQGTLTDIGASLRPNLGGKEANMTVMKLQASLIASGIKDAIGPYLETATSMLSELNEKGFTLDDSVMSLFNSMLKTGMGEGRIKTLAMGADQAIRGSQGESNAFMQTVFRQAGVGGKTIGGTQAAMQMGGLFGVDLNKYKGMSDTDKKMFKSLGIGRPDFMQKVSGGLLHQMDQLFKGQHGTSNRLARFRFMQNLGLAKDPGQAAEVESLLKKATKATPKEQKEIMKQIQNIQDENKDPSLAELKKINASTAGIYDVLNNKSKTQLDEIGEATSKTFNMADELLTNIDKNILEMVQKYMPEIDSAITSVAKLFGYQSPEDQKKEQEKERSDELNSGRKEAEQLKSGKFGFQTRRHMKDLMNLPFDEQMEVGKSLKAGMEREKDKGFFRNRGYEEAYNSPDMKYIRRGIEGEERKKQRMANESMASSMMTVANPTTPAATQNSTPANISPEGKAILATLNSIRGHAKVTADNSREKGTLKPGSSSTSGN